MNDFHAERHGPAGKSGVARTALPRVAGLLSSRACELVEARTGKCEDCLRAASVEGVTINDRTLASPAGSGFPKQAAPLFLH
jgi:hypothetical protein